MDDEICKNCIYWEKYGNWGRCWGPESDGETLGFLLDAGVLNTRSDFSCQAFEMGDFEETSEEDEDDDS
jgi:hypothetical protein